MQSLQTPLTEMCRCISERQDLGMGDRIVVQLALVVSCRDHDTVVDDHRADRHVIVLERSSRLRAIVIASSSRMIGMRRMVGMVGIVTTSSDSPCSCRSEAPTSETLMAEGVGFEPTEGFPSHAFQACRFGRSRIPPGTDIGS